MHRIEVRDDNEKSNVSTAVLDIRYHKTTIYQLVYKEKYNKNLELTVIHAIERGQSELRKPSKWKLITNLPVKCKADAIEKLDWYALRWKSETVHKVLKSRCRAKDSKVRSAKWLANLIAMMCILAWRLLWLTIVNRTSPELPAKLVFTDTEIKLLERLVSLKDE